MTPSTWTQAVKEVCAWHERAASSLLLALPAQETHTAGQACYSSYCCSFVDTGEVTGSPVWPEVQAEGLVGASRGVVHIGAICVASEGTKSVPNAMSGITS